jgi:hypothetical protein
MMDEGKRKKMKGKSAKLKTSSNFAMATDNHPRCKSSPIIFPFLFE